jgi:putative oxidoreductase
MSRLRRISDLERKLASHLPARLRRLVVAGDRIANRFMERHGADVLRVALAIVFLWFGALKVLDRSPVEEIVKQTVFFLPGDSFFFLLGLWELAIGLGLLVPVAPRVTLVLFWLQMGGTFLTLVVLPELAFQGGNPLLLSVLGEFVVKNLVLIAAGLAIGPSLRRRTAWHRASTSHHSLPQSERE